MKRSVFLNQKQIVRELVEESSDEMELDMENLVLLPEVEFHAAFRAVLDQQQLERDTIMALMVTLRVSYRDRVHKFLIQSELTETDAVIIQVLSSCSSDEELVKQALLAAYNSINDMMNPNERYVLCGTLLQTLAYIYPKFLYLVLEISALTISDDYVAVHLFLAELQHEALLQQVGCKREVRAAVRLVSALVHEQALQVDTCLENVRFAMALCVQHQLLAVGLGLVCEISATPLYATNDELCGDVDGYCEAARVQVLEQLGANVANVNLVVGFLDVVVEAKRNLPFDVEGFVQQIISRQITSKNVQLSLMAVILAQNLVNFAAHAQLQLNSTNSEVLRLALNFFVQNPCEQIVDKLITILQVNQDYRVQRDANAALQSYMANGARAGEVEAVLNEIILPVRQVDTYVPMDVGEAAPEVGEHDW